MFLRWGAAYSRAHLIYACNRAPVRGFALAFSLAFFSVLGLPHCTALAASDSVFVHGTGATNGAAPTSPTLGGQATPGFTAPALSPSVQMPTVQTPTVQNPTVAAPASPATPQVSPLTAPGVPAPAQAQQPHQ